MIIKVLNSIYANKANLKCRAQIHGHLSAVENRQLCHKNSDGEHVTTEPRWNMKIVCELHYLSLSLSLLDNCCFVLTACAVIYLHRNWDGFPQGRRCFLARSVLGAVQTRTKKKKNWKGESWSAINNLFKTKCLQHQILWKFTDCTAGSVVF